MPPMTKTPSETFGLISSDERNKLLENSPSPDRVTPDYMTSRIADVVYTLPKFEAGETFTLCRIKLDNGFTVFGESACVDPRNYREDLGKKIAFDKAFEKLWPLFGFLLSEKRFLQLKDVKL